MSALPKLPLLIFDIHYVHQGMTLDVEAVPLQVQEINFKQLLDMTCLLLLMIFAIFTSKLICTSFSIYSGVDVQTATNKTVPKFNTTYKFSTRISGQIQQIYIVARPDIGSSIPAIYSFAYRFYTPNYNQDSTLKIVTGFNYTNSEKYQISQMTFIIIACSCAGGILIFSIFFTYICTKFQYYVSPPSEHVKFMEQRRQDELEFRKSVLREKSKSYSKSEWNKQKGNESFEDDEMRATTDYKPNKNGKNISIKDSNKRAKNSRRN
ncbi:UNKNOWN [Stylonychia lemnae]|uniref:Transmembrane protein n=1 Tax=Stylonychia lemnae TaxID=5949 RepID=A0A078BAM8_STYLE|nr:UNKNOWN [Stylonychia lemnae]|eukprot:CDW90623.1 UNKNOWN [Stylonychia lemnae]